MAIADTARLVASLELQDKFSKPALSITGSLTRMESNFGRIGRGAGQVAGGLSRIGTVAAGAAAGGLAAVVKTAIDFEDAFAGVRKTVEATDVELDALFNRFREMARETGIAVEEFSRIGEIAGALGVATDSIDEFALAIAKASSATGLSVDELADSVGRLGNILKLDASTYETFLSTVVELGNKGASTEAEILEIATRFAATGKAAGLSTPQILGLSSAIASIGLQPEAAGTALSRITSNLITEVANGTSKAKNFAKVAGTSFKEFADIVEKDTLGAVLKFLEGLNGLSKLEKFQALKAAGITGARDRQTLLGFADGIGEVNRQLGVAQDEYGKTNALTEEFRKRQETVAKQLAIVKENVRDAAFTIGEQLLPIISEVSKEFVEFLNLPSTQTAIKDFAADLATGIRGFADELRNADFSGLVDTLKTAADVARTALDIFNALPGPLKGALIAGVALNKVSFGGVELLLKGIGNIAFGAGGLLARGSPTNPMFVHVVNQGIGGPGGGVPGAGGFSFGRLALQLSLFGTAALALIELAKAQDPGAQQRKAMFGNEKTIGRPVKVEIVNTGKITVGGLPTVSGPPREAAPQFAAMKQSIDELRRTARQELRAGNINAARHADRLANRLEALRGTVSREIDGIIPHLGKVHRALSFANRNLEEGNQRQRAIADRVSEARSAIGAGFQRSNAQLGVIAGKDFSPNVNVTVPVTTNVSISDIVRQASTYNVATSYASQTRRGFTP